MKISWFKKTVCFSDDLTNKDRNKKRNIALKLHCQFSHPNAQKLISLLKDVKVDDKESIAIINDVSDNCEICLKYKKPKPRPTVAFPLAKCFNETVVLDLKEWPSSTWFLHMIDYLTRFIASFVITSKRKEGIVTKIFQICISIFGSPNQFLVDNEGEFNNHKFISLCDKR